MFKVKEFSMFAKVSARMLRHYDKTGLLKPAFIDEDTGYRYYSADQIPLLDKIVTYRDLGFSIEEIEALINASSVETLKALLKKRRQAIQATMEIGLDQMSRLDHILSSVGKENPMKHFNVLIKSVSQTPVISVRDKVSKYENEVDLWERLGRYCMENGLAPAGAPFAIYHDGEFKEENIDIEVVMPIEKSKRDKPADQDSLQFRTVEEEACMATVLHEGDYTTIDEAFYFLARWIETNGYKITGKVRQVSLKGAWNESDPQKYLVEVQMPVEKC